MFSSIFIHFKWVFQTITQSFYIGLSHINIRTRNKISAGVLFIRGRNNYTRGRTSQNILNFSEKISQSRKLSHSAENTLFHILIYALPILIHRLGFRLSAPYLNTCIAYLNTLSRLSAPYLNTCIAYPNTLSRLSTPYLNTCITYPNTLTRLHILIHAILLHWVGSIS